MDTAQKMGRVKKYTRPRERVEAWVDTDDVKAIDALPTTRTEFIAEAIREKLERQRSEGVQ